MIPAAQEYLYADIARTLQGRIEQLAQLTDEPGRLTRLFGGPALCQAAHTVAGWMQEAGLEVRRDVVGNVIGRSRTGAHSAGTWVMGSHIDTVPDAGRYDGALGVLIGIAVADVLRSADLPFALEIVAFADEEGTRFGTSYLGSRAYRDGFISTDDLARSDVHGISLKATLEAFPTGPPRPAASRGCPSDIVGYLEAHIEQGPVLDAHRIALGVVTGIRGQATGRVAFRGQAGHAGTVPMPERRDALCAAAELIVWIETLGQSTPGLVTTVGEISVEPGARNVIPSHVQVSIEMRHADAAELRNAMTKMHGEAAAIAERREVHVTQSMSVSQAPQQCNAAWSAILADSAKSVGHEPISLDSGAGHDAAVLAERTGIAMLFLRCKDGVSHHPDESVSTDDIRAGIACVTEFFIRVAGSPKKRTASPTT